MLLASLKTDMVYGSPPSYLAQNFSKIFSIKSPAIPVQWLVSQWWIYISGFFGICWFQFCFSLMENFDFCLIFLISKFFSSIDFFHMIFYIVILPSLFKLYLVYLVTNILLVTHAFNNLNVYRLQIDKDMYYFLKKKRRTKRGLQHLQHI